ncbi:MAG: peptidoglycan-binding domain-containing protein, partial [Clostridia bacterium]|nr:peptidoglycan-binding domain-containing protein [Clostridia bacterium]
LYELGWFTSVRDGDYGSITQTAVKRFQQAAGLEITGIATPEVQEAIYAENAVRSEANATPAPDDSIASVVGEEEEQTTAE